MEKKAKRLREKYMLRKALSNHILHGKSINELIFQQMIIHRNCKEAFLSIAKAYSHTIRMIKNTTNLKRYLEALRPYTHT